jgi:CRISPR/Cas system-associated endonuclease Cas1
VADFQAPIFCKCPSGLTFPAEYWAAGFDSSIGLAHTRHTNRAPLVHDLVEPLRPVVDRAVFSFVLSHTFEPGDFTVTKLGGCRLNPGLAKIVAGLVAALETGPMVKGLLGRI